MKHTLAALLLVCLISLTGCRPAPEPIAQTGELPDGVSYNACNSRSALIGETVYFLGAGGKDLYAIPRASQDAGGASVVYPDIKANLIAPHNNYIYYTSLEDSEVYRMDTERLDQVPTPFAIRSYVEAQGRKSPGSFWISSLQCVGDTLYIQDGESSDAFWIQDDRKAAFDLEWAAEKAESGSAPGAGVPKTAELLKLRFSTMIDSVSNFDLEHLYFIWWEEKQLFREEDRHLCRVALDWEEEDGAEAFEDVEAYFPGRSSDFLDICEGWIYYDYGDAGKARVRCDDLSQMQVLVDSGE